jgi:hypothetical protein
MYSLAEPGKEGLHTLELEVYEEGDVINSLLTLGQFRKDQETAKALVAPIPAKRKDDDCLGG